MKAAGITWRNAMDGNTGGPISTTWNGQRWPTWHFLDPSGRIRARDVSGIEELDRRIDEIVRETPPRR
ncbi:MAG: hypothetical protein HY292_12965 [Planctomycetes bacterium]|nr:hypothetical protein [Planctomycetota bacterium]